MASFGLDWTRYTASANSDAFELLEDWQGGTRFGKYTSFAISNEATKYKLSLGSYSGDSDTLLHYVHATETGTIKLRQNGPLVPN